jgi:acyl-CoA thioesterase-2
MLRSRFNRDGVVGLADGRAREVERRMDFAAMMTLEQHGPDTYVGAGPSYPWGGLYGGQIVAQSLRAAAATVDEGLEVHSLHAYFIRTGDAAQPIRFEVDRLRNGRSFVTRQVVSRQPIGAICTTSVSFQRPEAGPEVQTSPMPDVPMPDDLVSETWSAAFDRRFVATTDQGRSAAWLRMAAPIGDDRLVHACALTYQSDDLPTDAVVALHPDRRTAGHVDEQPFFSASLDHAIWFHRPFRADDWLLHDLTSQELMSSRGLAVGRVFSVDGLHVATVTQEVLLRARRG